MADWHDLYPFQSHELSVQGLKYHYLDEGESDKPVVLMVHGNPTWSFYWRNLVLALRDEYRVVVPDHIGCGLSARPTRREYPFTLQRRMDDLAELIAALDLHDITLFAHDWGGAIGMGTAVDHPERFSRFILSNTAAFPFPRIPKRIALCRCPIFGEVMVQGFNAFAQAAVRMAPAKKLPPDVRAGLIAPYDTWRNRLATLEFVKDIPMSSRDRSWDTLQKIEAGLRQFSTCPVCFIWGMKDWCFPPVFVEKFLEYLPQAKVHELPEAGHYLMEDAWEEIVPIVREFLAAR